MTVDNQSAAIHYRVICELQQLIDEELDGDWHRNPELRNAVYTVLRAQNEKRRTEGPSGAG